jgi:hypothetical protein
MRWRPKFFVPLALLGGMCSGSLVTTALGQSAEPLRRELTCAAPHPGQFIDDGAQPYDDWLNNTVQKLSGDDENEQNTAADRLAIVVAYPPDRDKVLAGVEPHLNSPQIGFRLRCIRAYRHWATPAQVRQLLQVLASPQDPPAISDTESCWATATAALVELDPRAAKTAMEQRIGDFFYRTNLTGALTELTAENGTSQPAAFDLLKQLDPGNEAVQLSVSDAVALLRSDSAGDRTRGANALAHAVVSTTDRAAVLALLKPHLMGNSGRARLPFVQAFAHWATQQDVPTLASVVAYPATVSGLTGHEDCWAAATVGLSRLDPQIALEAAKSRGGVFFYRASLHRFLEPIAQSNSPMAATAEWLLNQVESGRNQPPLPPNFDPTQPMTPMPTDGADEHKRV